MAKCSASANASGAVAAPAEADLRSLVQAAYQLGRQAREAELRELLAGVAEEPRRGASAQPGGRKRGAALAAQARAWQEPAAIWAQELLDQGRLVSAKPSRYELAVHLAENWSNRPFPDEPVRPDKTTGPPSVENLSRRLIAKWKLRWPAQQ